MQSYQNLNGNSKVDQYAIAEKEIRVRFVNGHEFTFNHIAPGKTHVDKMKQLATQGSGLNNYITNIVKRNYAAKSED